MRSYDSNTEQWTTPDAYKGDAHDPMSQRGYMWNANNPIANADPSGFITMQAPPYSYVGDAINEIADATAPTYDEILAYIHRCPHNCVGPTPTKAQQQACDSAQSRLASDGQSMKALVRELEGLPPLPPPPDDAADVENGYTHPVANTSAGQIRSQGVQAGGSFFGFLTSMYSAAALAGQAQEKAQAQKEVEDKCDISLPS